MQNTALIQNQAIQQAIIQSSTTLALPFKASDVETKSVTHWAILRDTVLSALRASGLGL